MHLLEAIQEIGLGKLHSNRKKAIAFPSLKKVHASLRLASTGVAIRFPSLHHPHVIPTGAPLFRSFTQRVSTLKISQSHWDTVLGTTPWASLLEQGLEQMASTDPSSDLNHSVILFITCPGTAFPSSWAPFLGLY